MKGKIIVIEGSSDGVGKTTQAKHLVEKLTELGEEVEFYHFPAYNTPGAKLVETYLQGELGPRENLSPYLVGSFYAMDRAYSYQRYLQPLLNAGKTIILDRYTTSSMFYQTVGMTITEKEKFIAWIKNYEYELLGLPEPDMILFLSVPESMARQLRAKRKKENNTTDIHEEDQNFLQEVYENGKWLAKREQWEMIDCVDDQGNMRNTEEINHQILNLVVKKCISYDNK